LLKSNLILSLLLAFLPMQTSVVSKLEPEDNQAEPGIARLIIDKGLARINNDARKNVIADIYSVDEEYVNKQAMINNSPKSKRDRKKIITGRPSLDGMSVDELYKAFAIRFDFFIDNNESIGVIDNTRYALIKFAPKPNLTSNTVTDALINRTAGKVYINLDNYEIVRIEGSISNHFVTTWRAWWSPISFDIDVYEFSFSIDYTVFNNIVIEKNLDGMVDYEIRTRGIDKHTYTLRNYRMQR
jgi:hypothetical protein